MRFNRHDVGIGVRLIDSEHNKITSLLVELRHVLTSGHSIQHGGMLLSKLRQILFTHFALEESLMQAVQYPHRERHRLEHQWLAEQARALALRIRHCDDLHNDPLLPFFVQAHVSHMQQRDLQFGLWLAYTAVPTSESMIFVAESRIEA